MLSTSRRRFGRLFALGWATALAFLPGGCLHVYTSQTYTVTVLDGDTNRPVPNARVELIYLRSEIDINNPSDEPTGVTDGQGKVALAGTTFVHTWVVRLDDTYLSNGRWQEPDSPASDPASVQLKVYRRPKPTLSLIIPDGFHGPVMINPGGPGEPLGFTPGQRQFTFRVPPSGLAVFKAPGIFHTQSTDAMDDFSLIFVTQDGREIPQARAFFSGDKFVAEFAPGPASRSAFNAMNFEANTHFGTEHPIWVIGALGDAEAVARKLYLAHQDGLGHDLNYPAFEAMFSPSSAPPTTSAQPAQR
jgi:hypothetical protein